MLVKFAGNVPVRSSEEAAGLDLIADLAWNSGTLKLAPGERALVPTGTYMELPPGYVGLLTPRSGLAMSSGLTIVNSPGVIDSDFRGEIKVILLNTDKNHFMTIGHGQRIAQLVIQQLPEIEIEQAKLSDFGITSRGDQGFGSTGKW